MKQNETSDSGQEDDEEEEEEEMVVSASMQFNLTPCKLFCFVIIN